MSEINNKNIDRLEIERIKRAIRANELGWDITLNVMRAVSAQEIAK